MPGERRSAIRDVTTLDIDLRSSATEYWRHRLLSLPISVAAWFNARGFGLVLSQEGAVWWARLTPKANPESVIDRYGKGDTPVAAAQRARERYEHGRQPDKRPRRDSSHTHSFQE